MTEQSFSAPEKLNLRRLLRRLLLMGFDAALVTVAFLLAYELRFNFSILPEYVPQFEHLVVPVILAHIGCFVLFQLYRGVTRYTGIREFRAIASGATLALFAMLLYNLQIIVRHGLHSEEIKRIPFAVVALTWLLVIIFTAGLRYARRLVAEGQIGWRSSGERRGVLIIGADARGESIAREMLRNRASGRVPVGFIDENRELHGRLIHGIEVFGGLDSLSEVLQQTEAAEIIVALPNPSPRQMKEIADSCGKSHISIQRLPSAEEVLDGRVSLERLRPVKIEDLLGRPPVHLQLTPEDNYISGKRVLVTGAGGSIGSELCRQIMRCNPARLYLLGRGENSLYEIASELGYWSGNDKLEIVLADIQNEDLMRHVFERCRPQIVFHSAAHKHVPFGELAPAEMARNNIFGTLYAARAAMLVEAERFILISTDKAVKPNNVLGATKRVAEMTLAWLGEQSATQFLAVRFGNVLGSRGSVVPLFLKQIEAGGPITLTDPEMTRFFMTIPEAASLVLQAGAIGTGGQLMVLDMGEPVKIADLARNMITLAGYEPGRDIEIKFIGARPGEKVHEELLTAQEGLSKTRSGKILVTSFAKPDGLALKRELELMREAIDTSDHAAVRQSLSRLVESFKA